MSRKRLKFAEIFAAGFAAAGFFLHSVPLLFVALGLFGIIAALFGPVKYGILPDQLATGELATGNALVEGATFLAILIGTIAGGLFVTGSSHRRRLRLDRRRGARDRVLAVGAHASRTPRRRRRISSSPRNP